MTNDNLIQRTVRLARRHDASHRARNSRPVDTPYETSARGHIHRQLRKPLSWRSVSSWAMVLPAAVTLLLGGISLGRASMWTDEADTWINSIQPVSNIFRNTTHLDVMFLPYYLFMHFWLDISQSMWWMRLPSLLVGAATVEAVVLLARRWLPLAWSVLAGLLLALNPLFVTWTMEARAYTAATLFAVLSMGALVTAIDRGTKLRWARYGLASLCMLLFQLTAVFVLVAQLVGVAIARQRTARRGMALTLACVAAAVSPIVVIAAGETRLISWVSSPTLRTFPQALVAVSGGRFGGVALVVCCIVLVTIMTASASGSETALSSALCLAWGALAPLLLVLVSFLHPIYVDRYTLVFTPGTALIEAMAGWRAWIILTALGRTRETSGEGTHESSQLGFVRHRGHVPRWASIAVLIGFCAACFFGITLLNNTSRVLQYRYFYDDYRSAANALSNDLSERPASVMITPDWVGVGFSYYAVPSTLAHVLGEQMTQALNRQMIDWQPLTLASGTDDSLEAASVLHWPNGAESEISSARCAVGWAIGRGVAPSKTFIIDGSSCRLSQVHYYGEVWVASVAG